MNWLNKKLDSSQLLGRLLSQISTLFAVQRGIPMLIGTILTVFSCIATGFVMPIIVSSSEVNDIWLLICIPALLLHLAVFIGFAGFMMAAPLGKGYKE